MKLNHQSSSVIPRGACLVIHVLVIPFASLPANLDVVILGDLDSRVVVSPIIGTTIVRKCRGLAPGAFRIHNMLLASYRCVVELLMAIPDAGHLVGAAGAAKCDQTGVRSTRIRGAGTSMREKRLD
ncbi:uncharacterized protein BDZ83DRAFT_384542 [Colletotrichum acutatum]|uniref:Uncharacterized protein n=1 Tax=Glomerella acutata TaxID=27357 RepID=A0AAD8UKM3_GLOAC|nr:uncharacterized protein BDZ83DRAFT_384542 [Colletotrichum acutatum]KAK1723620.1 hypothetical protein BDZ83DRAFT_384542 [Colletotrichum acutatum]